MSKEPEYSIGEKEPGSTMDLPTHMYHTKARIADIEFMNSTILRPRVSDR